MATYDHKQVLADYAAGRITPEMAVGHSLQHIVQIYEAQAATRVAWQAHHALPGSVALGHPCAVAAFPPGRHRR